jgi:hypothetical protein
MPERWACAQILWSNLWITRSWLAQPHIWHSLQPTARFLIKLLRAKPELESNTCPQVVLDSDAKQFDAHL